jgi:hypothetical protein
LKAAIKAASISFNVYDANFFKGEGTLEGDWTVMSENTDSEYAIVILKTQEHYMAQTITGDREEMRDIWKVFYPFYDKGDASVGLEDAWIIDFEETEPDYVADSITNAAVHAVNWFMNNEMRMAIDSALSAEEFQYNHSINPED